jgi:predicted  nucleic acid-binding Zn-ribbon protein
MTDEGRRLLVSFQAGLILGFLLAGATIGLFVARNRPSIWSEEARLARQREELRQEASTVEERVEGWKSRLEAAEQQKRQLEYDLQKAQTRITTLEAAQK